MSHLSYNDENLHSYTLPKKDFKKIMNHVTHLLSSADISIFFHLKPISSAISKNTDVDCIVIYNF